VGRVKCRHPTIQQKTSLALPTSLPVNHQM